MSRALVIQHVPGEGPYLIGSALEAAGIDVDLREAWHDPFSEADLDDAAALVVMGGPMSVTSTHGFPTRDAEIELLRAALARGIPILGICLGAQLLAAAAGGTVRIGDGLEIGWLPIQLTADAADDLLFATAPDDLSVLHWHGDTFSMPNGAVHLARSERYTNQAFRVGDRSWGLQFHAEVDADACASFAEQFPQQAALVPGGEEAIIAAAGGTLTERRALLGRFAALAAVQNVP